MFSMCVDSVAFVFDRFQGSMCGVRFWPVLAFVSDPLPFSNGWRVQTGWGLGEFSFLPKTHQDFHSFISLVGWKPCTAGRWTCSFLPEKKILDLNSLLFLDAYYSIFQGMKKWTLKTCWHLLSQKFVAKWFCGDKGWCFFIYQSVQARPINGIITTGDLAGSNPFDYIKPYRNHGKTRCIPAIGSVQVQCATVVVINISCNLLKPAPLCIDFECLGSDFPFFLEDKTPGEIPVKILHSECSGPQKTREDIAGGWNNRALLQRRSLAKWKV